MTTLSNPPAAHHGNPTGPAITLSNDGSQWTGTFGIVVHTLIKDLLDDGEGFTATITTFGPLERTGTVQSIDEGGYITMGDPDSEDPYNVIPLEDVVRIDVH